MNTRDLPIRGVEETIAVLAALPEQMQKNALKRGMRAAAAVVRDEARFRAPRKTGGLAKRIKSGNARRETASTYSIRVRVDDFRGIFFEYGVAPHFITSGDSNVSARKLTQSARNAENSAGDDSVLVINGQFVSGAVFHPGIAAKPFLRPALDIKADEAVRALAFVIEEFVFDYTGFQSAA